MSRAGMPFEMNDDDITGRVFSFPFMSTFSMIAFSSFAALMNFNLSSSIILTASSC